MWRRLWKQEDGQSLVMVALLMSVFLGFAALVVDVGFLYVEKGQMQNAVDAAALAGAQNLPNQTTAKNSALEYAKLNGIEQGVTVNTPYKGNANQIEVISAKRVPYLFAKVLGFNETDMSVRAVAEKAQGVNGTRPFDFAVFHGSDNATFSVSGATIVINGSLHSNSAITWSGANGFIKGSLEAVKSINVSGANLTVKDTIQAATINQSGSDPKYGKEKKSPALSVKMPDFSQSLIAQAQTAHQVYETGATFSHENTKLNSPIYVKGNVTISGANFTGPHFIIATGNISVSGAGSGLTGNYYSINGHISISGEGAQIDGLIYAPKGEISFSGANPVVKGRVIGNKISFSGAGVKVTPQLDDLEVLPLSGGVKLVK